MIAVYAQAEAHEGLVAAMNGRAVMADDLVFNALRRKSIALNIKRKPIQAGAVKMNFGDGVARLEFVSTAPDDDSPVVVVVEVESIGRDIHAVAEAVLSTASAIDRRLDRSQLEQALEVASHVIHAQAAQKFVVIGLAVGAALIAVSAVRHSIVASRRTR